MKNRIQEKTTYTPIEKFLHYVFLGNSNISKALFRFELFLNKKTIDSEHKIQSLYISGLARAGTTVLMQYFGQISEFKSLSYKNLPFLFLPRTWPKFISKKSRRKNEKERFHQDGIKHDINSYEALEEPFWRNYMGENYIKDCTIVKHKIDLKLHTYYNFLRKLVASNKIYLAKNNNHLLRAKSLHGMDKKSGNIINTIIPFRNPYEQANSLLKQHLLLSEYQSKDPFVLDYMDFLVHHEFGLNHKISILGEIDLIKCTNKSELDYWLEIWYLYYSDVYAQFSNEENFYFFNYNNFVLDPYSSLKNIMRLLSISEKIVDSLSIKEFKPRNKVKLHDQNDKYISLFSKLNYIAVNNEN